jgi:hypothetical protein
MSAGEGSGKYAVAVRGSRSGHRVTRVLQWEPSTYRQVWVFAVLGLGVPGFCILLAIAESHSLVRALTYAVSATFLGGIGLSWRLHRRRGLR